MVDGRDRYEREQARLRSEAEARHRAQLQRQKQDSGVELANNILQIIGHVAKQQQQNQYQRPQYQSRR